MCGFIMFTQEADLNEFYQKVRDRNLDFYSFLMVWKRGGRNIENQNIEGSEHQKEN